MKIINQMHYTQNNIDIYKLIEIQYNLENFTDIKDQSHLFLLVRERQQAPIYTMNPNPKDFTKGGKYWKSYKWTLSQTEEALCFLLGQTIDPTVLIQRYWDEFNKYYNLSKPDKVRFALNLFRKETPDLVFLDMMSRYKEDMYWLHTLLFMNIDRKLPDIIESHIKKFVVSEMLSEWGTLAKPYYVNKYGFDSKKQFFSIYRERAKRFGLWKEKLNELDKEYSTTEEG